MREWAQMQAREGLILVAREQTSGRGRLRRGWESPPGGLYLSLLLRPAISVARANQLTMLVSLAALDACREISGVRAKPKWPNDLLLNDKKLAGVLTELGSSGSRLDYAVIGLGLNVNNDFSRSALAETATSMKMVTGVGYDIERVLEAFVAAMGKWYGSFLRGMSPHRAWAQNLEPIGRRVVVHQSARQPLRGRAEGVSEDGALLVRDDTGVLHTIWAGDVVIE